MTCRAFPATLVVSLAVACSDGAPSKQPPPSTSQVIDKPTSIVTLPAIAVRREPPADSSAPDALTILLEKEDREAEGPQSFDVRPDGSFVVADPLRDRLMVFSRGGAVVQRIAVGAEPRTVTALGDRFLQIASASQGAGRTVDYTGAPVDPSAAANAGAAVPPSPSPQIALDEGRRAGSIKWAPPPTRGAARGQAPAEAPAQLQIQAADDGSRLASLQVIAVDPQRRVYVAVEATPSSPGGDVTKTIRRYDAAGKLELEIRSIPIDYYVVPLTEFRVVRDVVYQLLPHSDAVLINVWELAK